MVRYRPANIGGCINYDCSLCNPCILKKLVRKSLIGKNYKPNKGWHSQKEVTLGDVFPGMNIHIENNESQICGYLQCKCSSAWVQGPVEELPNFYILVTTSSKLVIVALTEKVKKVQEKLTKNLNSKEL